MASQVTPISTARSGSHDPNTTFVRTVAEAVRQSKNAVLNDPAVIAGATTFTHTGVGAVTRLIVDRLNDTIDAADFGVVGDSFTDDTIAAQKALTAGAVQNKIVNFNGLTVRITAGLTCSGPGLCFDTVSHGVSAGPGFYMSGTGYVGITFTGAPQCVAFCLYGNGQAVTGGVLFTNPQRARVQHVRVYNLNGYGCQINQMYDCLFETISVELCGNTTAGQNGYAFSIGPGADTSNMSHILRLQVEQANAQAIYVDPSTLSCVIDDIHSERATVNASYVTWSLGGECFYLGGRFNASGTSANATLHLNGLNATYANFRVEGNIPVEWISTGATMTLLTPNIAGTLKNVPNQTGTLEIVAGTVTTLTADPYGLRAYGTVITSLDVEVGPNPPDATLARFENCDIAMLAAPTSALSAATFVNCKIGEGHNLLKGLTVLIGCVVTFASKCTVAGPLYARGTQFVGDMDCNGYSLFDNGCFCTGAVTNPGPPAQATFPGKRGMHSANLLPGAASDDGWLCTLGGGPGTWVAIGSTLAHTLTIGTHLTGGSFNGSADVTIATDAVSTNTASTIVARDGSGNFSAGTITAALTGNASTATTAGTVTAAAQPAITSVGTLTALTVSPGASALQAVTATTITASGLISTTGAAVHISDSSTRPLDVVTSATTSQVVIDTTAGNATDVSLVSFKRNGVSKWAAGNNVATGSDAFDIQSSGVGVGLSINKTTLAATFGATAATADPGLGVGAWKLGKYITGAISVPLLTNYIQVMIDGVAYKVPVGT